MELAGRRNPGTVNENDLNNNFSKFLQSLGKNVERKQLKIPSHRSSGAYVTLLARHRPAEDFTQSWPRKAVSNGIQHVGA